MNNRINHPFTSYSRFATLLVLALAVMAVKASAAGTDRTYSGTGAHAWNNAANWTGGIPDTTGENAVFGTTASDTSASYTISGTGYTVDKVSVVSAGYAFGQLHFSGKPTGTSGWWLYSGTTGTLNPMTMNGNGGANPVVLMDSACTVAIMESGAGHNVKWALGLSGANEIQVNGTVLQIVGYITNGVGVTAGLTKTGSGTLQLALYNMEQYNGDTTISAGTLQLNAGNANQIPYGTGYGNVVMNPSSGTATLDLNGNSQNVNGLTSSGAGSSLVDGTSGTPTLTVGNNNASSTFSGVVQNTAGTLALTKTGAGTLTLSGTNTYTGKTTISAGTLALGATGSISNSATLSIAAGATFDVSAIPAYDLSSTALSTSGAATAAAINGAAGGTVSLGAQPITLAYDGSHPALYISQGTLSLSGNAFTVNKATPLTAGDYTIVQQASGTITASGFPTTATGTAIAAGYSGVVSVSGTNVILTVSTPAASISVETAADGSGTVVPAQSLGAGSNLTMYAIARGADGTFVANTVATWSLTNVTGGVVSGDLIAAGDKQSATFTAHLVGTATVQATAGALTSTNSGTLAVLLGPATQVRVETAAGGSGTVVPAQTVAYGNAITVYAITRDAGGNFIANAAADSWTTVNDTGGVQDANLSPGSGPSSTFTANAPGSGKITATISGLTSVVSGLITVPFPLMVWSAAPATYQWDTGSANWMGGTGIYADGDLVQFTDAGSASSPIELVGPLSPASVTVNTSTNNYIFSGSGYLSGTNGFVKSGSSILTLSNTTPNTYTGGTFVNGGTLVLATTNCFAIANPSPITIASNATLIMVRDPNATGTLNWSNSVSGMGLWQVGTGTGSQSTALDGDYSAFTGTLEVATGGGKIVFSTAARFPSASATLQLDTNLTAYINVSGTFASAIRMYGGTTGEALGQLRLYDAVTVSGLVTLFANTTMGVDSGRTATIRGTIGGSFGFTKLSAGALTLSATNTYAGSTVIKAGTLALGATGSISNSPALSIAAGATFDVSAITPYVWNAGTALSASGAATAAAIKGASGGIVNLGSQPITLTYDGSHVALSVAQGTLWLNGNPFTVNSSPALAAGTYTIVQQASGSIVSSGTYPAVTGTAIDASHTGAISVTGNGVNLVVSNSAASPPATNLTIVVAGPASFRLSGQGGANQAYGIYASTNVAAPMTNWWLIGATNADAGGVIQFLDTQATNAQRFYRFRQ